jgi:hypothetical protein
MTAVFATGIESLFKNVNRDLTQVGALLLLLFIFFACLPLLKVSKIGGIVVIVLAGFMLAPLIVAPDSVLTMLNHTWHSWLKGT